MQYLSKSDFDLVFHATGQRVDASSELVPMFAEHRGGPSSTDLTA